jgi:hypothetical protein
LSAQGKESLVQTAQSAMDDAKPVHGNLWF